MGKLERQAQEQRIQGNIQKAVLVSVGIAGGLAIALVAPNLFQVARMFGFKITRLHDKSRTAVARLIEKGYMTQESIDGKDVLVLSKKGEDVLETLDQHTTKRQKPKRWDKRWRLVVFDIPEKRRKTRNKLRNVIVSAGFIKVQDSVWVYPYDSEDLIALLKTDLRLGREVLYAVVEKIENDAWLRRHFKLPVS